MGLMAAALPAIIAAGGQALGSWLGRSEPAQQGYDVVNMPTYDWANDAQQGTNKYLMEMLNAMKRGETPAWMNYLNPIEEGMHKESADRFYGTAGRPGMLRDVMGAASMGGVGPKAMMTKAQQSTSDFMSEGDKIDQYISSLKYNTMANQSLQVPQMLANMPRGPESQIVSYGGGGSVGNNMGNMGNMIGDFAKSVPWEDVFSNPGKKAASQYVNMPYGGNYDLYASQGYGSSGGYTPYGTTPSGYSGSKTYF